MCGGGGGPDPLTPSGSAHGVHVIILQQKLEKPDQTALALEYFVCICIFCLTFGIYLVKRALLHPNVIFYRAVSSPVNTGDCGLPERSNDHGYTCIKRTTCIRCVSFKNT